jgi:sec-independent protein translocase protein TatB
VFDVGFFELLLIGTIGLLVLGPERLPRAARTVGLWMRKARGAWYAMRAEMEREFADEELKRSLAATRAELDDARRALNESGRQLADAGAEVNQELRRGEQALRDSVHGAAQQTDAARLSAPDKPSA